MAFAGHSLESIYTEIRRRQQDAGRLSLVEFDDDEYAILLDWAQRIAREYGDWPQQRHLQDCARLVFLAFAISFVRHTKYTADNIFWPEFEAALKLGWMEHRLCITNELLWPAYAEEGIEQRSADVYRRIVGSLVDEIQESGTWLVQARTQFVEFFVWYYHRCPDAPVTRSLVETYRSQTGFSLVVLDRVLPALEHDCQALVKVLDYALEHGLYLHTDRLDDYRKAIIHALGPEHDPGRLRLVRDERALVRLILRLQNHRTPAQFERELIKSPGSRVIAPSGESQIAHQAHHRWMPLPYGLYHLDGQEYRVVPHSRLRLEMLDAWPFEQVVSICSTQMLGYKKATPFQVTIGHRMVDARPFVSERGKQVYIWAGQVPVGQKLTIDGHLCTESAGADWRVAPRLNAGRSDQPGVCIVIDLLALYYPNFPHAPVRISTSTGYEFCDNLRQDGVRRFHRHGALVIALAGLDNPVEVRVEVNGQQVLHAAFEPEPHMLFSVSSGEIVCNRGKADVGDREYVLFTQPGAGVLPGPGLKLEPLLTGLENRDGYRVIWEDSSWPFSLRVRTAHWAFERRREFAVLLSVVSSLPHVRLRPGQAHRFTDVSALLFSTLDLTTEPIELEVLDNDGELARLDIASYVTASDTASLFSVDQALWQHLGELCACHCGVFTLLFRHRGTLLDELRLSLVPRVTLVGWDDECAYLESEPLSLFVESEHEPAWDPAQKSSTSRVTLAVHPRFQLAPWSEHPGLRRIVSQPTGALLVFPNLRETVEVTVCPPLFGWRLHLQRLQETQLGRLHKSYQPITEADYYHLSETVLHVFAAPKSPIALAAGSQTAWTGQADANGDLLLEDLAFLRDACVDEWTDIVVRSGNLVSRFPVRWAPRILDLQVADEQAVVTFEGPKDTHVRLSVCDLNGTALATLDLPCQGQRCDARWPLPVIRPGLGYLRLEYMSSRGQTLPTIWQIALSSPLESQTLSEWLRAGIGVMDWHDVALLIRSNYSK